MFATCLALLLAACGGGTTSSPGNGPGNGGGGGSPPTVPTGLSASAGNQQVALTWNTSSGATSYPLGRSTTSGGPYTQIASPTSTSYTDQSLTNGTPYY